MSKRKDPVVVITGASSGIGRATALRFAKKEASLVLASRSDEALIGLVRECENLGGRAIAVPTEVAGFTDVQALAAAAVEAFERIDVWANNAGTTLFASFLEVPLEDFRRVLDVNVMGCVYGSRAAIRSLGASIRSERPGRPGNGAPAPTHPAGDRGADGRAGREDPPLAAARGAGDRRHPV